VRIVSINGVPSEAAARQAGVTVMSSDELFSATRIRRVPADTSAFVVNANGVLTRFNGNATEVYIPFMVNGVRVTAIGNEAFRGRNLTRVTIPDTVTSIGNNAFRDNRLTSVIIPGSVDVIGNEAFRDNQLVSITIGDSVTSIGFDAFRHNRLSNVTIPDSVRTIGLRAFLDNGSSGRGSPGRITIGAGVGLPGSTGWDTPFHEAFVNLYNQNGRRAGTYVWSGTAWTFTPR